MINSDIKPTLQFLKYSAKILTTLLIIFQAGCSFTYFNKQEACNTDTYLRTPLKEFINKRFSTNSPVRLGIIPFSTPANISYRSRELQGVGLEIASQIKNKFLQNGAVTIVEIMNRQDWAGKKEEFHAGNFTSLKMAHSAGYDLVMVGYIENLTSISEYSLQSKIIEVAGGITVWNGKNTITTSRHEHERSRPGVWFKKRKPAELKLGVLFNELAACAVDSILTEESVPE